MSKLRQYRKRHKLSLDQFGVLIGRSGATVSRIERGLDNPSWNTAEKIEQVTGGEITLGDLRAREGELAIDSREANPTNSGERANPPSETSPTTPHNRTTADTADLSTKARQRGSDKAGPSETVISGCGE
jgi:transcriptional regulator with XRE-family HTH domain